MPAGIRLVLFRLPGVDQIEIGRLFVDFVLEMLVPRPLLVLLQRESLGRTHVVAFCLAVVELVVVEGEFEVDRGRFDFGPFGGQLVVPVLNVFPRRSQIGVVPQSLYPVYLRPLPLLPLQIPSPAIGLLQQSSLPSNKTALRQVVHVLSSREWPLGGVQVARFEWQERGLRGERVSSLQVIEVIGVIIGSGSGRRAGILRPLQDLVVFAEEELAVVLGGERIDHRGVWEAGVAVVIVIIILRMMSELNPEHRPNHPASTHTFILRRVARGRQKPGHDEARTKMAYAQLTCEKPAISFNCDNKHYTPAFVDTSEKSLLPSVDKELSQAFKAKLRESNIHSQILAPKPSSRYCFACREQFSDYLKHTSHPVHQKKIANSRGQLLIQEVVEEWGRKARKGPAVGFGMGELGRKRCKIDESYCYSKRQGMFKEYSTCLPADVCQVTFLHE